MDIVLESGAEDIKNEGDHFEVICAISEYDSVSQALDSANIECVASELAYLANVFVPVDDKDTARKVLHLVEKIDELEDVKAVHHNMELSDSVLLEDDG